MFLFLVTPEYLIVAIQTFMEWNKEITKLRKNKQKKKKSEPKRLFKIFFYLSIETVMFVQPIFVSHVSLVIFYERIKIILVKSYLNTPSAHLPKMYDNGKKVSMCQILTVLSQHICDMFTVSILLCLMCWWVRQPSVSNFEKRRGSEKK